MTASRRPGRRADVPAAGAATSPRLAALVVRRFTAAGLTLAVAESCTGGLVAAAITAIPGASAAFAGGVVAYADAAKQALLGVPADTLGRDGAVSRASALAMAAGARTTLAADVAVAVTGIAGPGGAVPGKPVGTVWFAVAGPRGARAERRHFAGSRVQVRRQAVQHALAMLLDAAEDPAANPRRGFGTAT